MIRTTIIYVLMGLGLSGYSQRDSIAEIYAKSITAEELKEHLSILASDEYEGRETGLEGQKKAAKYIAEYFESLGVKPIIGDSYFQTFPLKKENLKASTIDVDGEEFNFIEDFFFFIFRYAYPVIFVN